MKSIIFSGDTMKKPPKMRAVNEIISSPLGVAILAVMTFLAFAFSLEFFFYCFVIIYAIYTALFADDLSPLMPLFIFCYITPSAKNNPGRNEESVFWGESGLFLLCFVSVAAILFIVRIALDKNMGFKRLFLGKKYLLPGLLLLGLAFLASGIGSPHYKEYALKNLWFATLQFLAFFLLYFIFSSSVSWDRFKPSYLASIGVGMGAIVTAELLYTYAAFDVVKDGIINRSNIYTGWGVYNNLGVILAMSIPFAFYFAARTRPPEVWFVIGSLLLGSTFLSCSRGAIVTAVPIYLVSVIFTFIKAKHKKRFRIATAAALGILFTVALIKGDEVLKIFAKVPKIFEIIGGELIINDSDRFRVYSDGLKAFRDAKIFGHTFFPVGYIVYDFAELEAFSAFFPPRWHNTAIQLLASSGIVGALAYAVHRVSTVVLYIKRRKDPRAYIQNVFIALSVGALLLASLLDCHLFNIGPTLFYSTLLAPFEFATERED
jgi:O-antigen ligase